MIKTNIAMNQETTKIVIPVFSGFLIQTGFFVGSVTKPAIVLIEPVHIFDYEWMNIDFWFTIRIKETNTTTRFDKRKSTIQIELTLFILLSVLFQSDSFC